MTAQSPERIVIDGRPRPLYTDPICDLLERKKIDFKSLVKSWSTGCYRCYRGTWEVRDRALLLIHFNLMEGDEAPLSPAARERLFCATKATSFPINAVWFSGRLRVAVGRRLIYSHHGWSSWYARERVIHIRKGAVVRDREVDTQAILEWHLKRHPEMVDDISGKTAERKGIPPPLTWFDKRDDKDWTKNWWPPDFKREPTSRRSRPRTSS